MVGAGVPTPEVVLRPVGGLDLDPQGIAQIGTTLSGWCTREQTIENGLVVGVDIAVAIEVSLITSGRCRRAEAGHKRCNVQRVARAVYVEIAIAAAQSVLIRVAHDRLVAYCPELPEIFHNQEPLVAEGHPSEEILKAVEATGCDLIAVGARGLGFVSRLILGSTSEKLLARAPCSLLIVREHRQP